MEPRSYDPDRDPSPLAEYAWPGGYNITYWDTDTAEAICPKHAWALLVREEPEPTLVAEIYWEGPPEWCVEGSHWIESEYGDPDSPEAMA